MSNKPKKKGHLIILSAPSGAGKSTICKELLAKIPKLKYSVSYTTRKPRKNEREGHDYFFVDEKIFLAMKKIGEFAETAEVHGAWYATSKKVINEILDAGNDVLLEIDVQGAMNLKKLYPDSVTIFISPPNVKELEARLRGRKSETEESIKKRLENAKEELKSKDRYEYVIINRDLVEAIGKVTEIIMKHRNE